MLDDFRPMGLDALAARIGVDPLEAVRMLVVAGACTDDQIFRPDHVEKLIQAGQIETWWSSPAPADPKARVRGALQMLVDRGLVGDKIARLDNLWRGLGADAEVIREAVDVLVADGLLQLTHTSAGAMVSIAARSKSEIERIAQGNHEPAALAAVWKR